MNIAFLDHANCWHVPIQVKHFVDRKHKVYYFATHPGTGQPIYPKGVINVDIISNYNNKFLSYIDKALQIRKYTKKYKIDILHVKGMGRAIYITFSLSKKVVVENRGSDLLVKPLKNKLLQLIYRILYKFADAVVQDSLATQKSGRKYGAPSKNNEIIELGVNLEIFNLNVKSGFARKKMGISQETKYIFSPRGFDDIYNIDKIIESIILVKDQYPDVKYVFCRHSGDSWIKYEKLSSDLGVSENVIFVGFLDNEKDMPYYYKDADVVVSVPSSDSSPRSVYEAMACGATVIVSELQWFHDKFSRNKDLLLVVPVRDSYALAEQILNVLNNKITIDAACTYKFVGKNINTNKHSYNLEKLYNKIMSE